MAPHMIWDTVCLKIGAYNNMELLLAQKLIIIVYM